MTSLPMVRVVVVNHQGRDLTVPCLESLRASDWPRERMQVVLVDNSPSDGVAKRVQAELPDVRVIHPGRNLGFAGGANLGLRDLEGVDYAALVNNDATVGPGWLGPLVAAVESEPDIGAASPKILFAGRFAEMEIAAPVAIRGLGDRRSLGVRVSGARVDGRDVWTQAQLIEGFWGVEHGPGEEANYQWTDAQARLRLPVPENGARTCALRLAADGDKTVVLASADEKLEIPVTTTPSWHELPAPRETADVVNNVGCVLLPGGYGADRGFLERDGGQYDQVEEVFAWCGAAVLLARRYLESVGLFDERYFLYYEDLDLAWRGRAQGWRYVYVPNSTVRHVHTASSVEGSRLFQHYVERNRLLTLARNAPPSLAAAAGARHLAITASYARRDMLSPMLHGHPPNVETVRRRMGAFSSYVRHLPGVLADRRTLRAAKRVSDQEVLDWAPERR